MNNLIKKLIKEGKITEDNADYINEIYNNFRNNYNYLSINDEAWDYIFVKLINKNIPFSEISFTLHLTSFLNNFIKNKVNNKDILILNNYLKKLIKEMSNYAVVLKQFYIFLNDLNINFDEEYFKFLKEKSELFKKILIALGIDDFNNELVKEYNAGYFEILKSWRFNDEDIRSILYKYKDILRYTSIKFKVDSNKEDDIRIFKNTNEYKKLRVIFKYYDKINNIYEDCLLLNKHLTLEQVKMVLFNFNYLTLTSIFEEYDKDKYLRDNNMLRNMMMAIISRIDYSQKPKEYNTINDLCLYLSNREYDKDNIVLNIFKEEHSIYQDLISINFLDRIESDNLAKKELKNIKEKYRVKTLKNLENEGDVYSFILGSDYLDKDKRRIVDLILSHENNKTIKDINLFFQNKIEDLDLKNKLINKTQKIKKEYNSFTYRMKSLNDIYGYILNEEHNDFVARTQLDYNLSKLSKEELEIINNYFNDSLLKEDYLKMYNILKKLKKEYSNWHDISVLDKTDDDLFNEIYHYIERYEGNNNIVNENIKLYIEERITNPYLQNILVYKLSNYYEEYLKKIKNNPEVIDYLHESLDINYDILNILVSNFKEKDFNILKAYFTKNENTTLAKAIINSILNAYNYYLFDGVFPRDYYIMNLFLKMNLDACKKSL